ncbi:MAG: DNA polymerase III, subunit gamma and tau [Candidatus Liptonbacteria bacterium RIFCSPLOWO2_01_FULL_52_25]|uniref:DNA polymerase III subunit gamma/tau n=1 Tax=Candidatus Liptonbacteria bacterium RIFCSPLOWO2_01_FULL_52_25 TaxID=1798650 RepID=A0A1G2CDK4_9BACT|nr:MAG: DNA polymerase III, subunit gamma and tau [Candidatus Liptonbacteria bacterium RIFCSPLOWO2_01_FULL_52_25]
MEPVRNSHTRIALYRKYRPKKLEDLLGQETNVQILKNAAAAGRLGHAYLFYGSRGTGKTSTARLIAKLLNCERRRDDAEFRKLGEPCNECRHCAEIDAQSSFDVIEIDAASNRGIDEIRNLKDSIKTSPSSGTYKVYIIDEAHMLTTPAFNALLKTLEEPPAHAVIVLATTEYEKLPATITSRTQRFVFKKLPKTKIMEKLAHIARTEKIEIDEPALELIAAAAEGSLRDAESLLDQISAMHPPSHEASARQGSKIGLADVERITGRVGLKRVHELTALIIQRDLKGCLAYLGELGEDGQNMVQFTKDLIHYFRKILSLKMSPALEKVFAGELTADEIEGVRKLGAALDQAVAVKLIKSFIRAYSEMRYSPFAVVPLEIALVENLSQQKGPAE